MRRKESATYSVHLATISTLNVCTNVSTCRGDSSGSRPALAAERKAPPRFRGEGALSRLGWVAVGVCLLAACDRKPKEKELPTVEFCDRSLTLDTVRVLCFSTSVTDLSPLAKLTQLHTLLLNPTSGRSLLTDLTPLAGLTQLDTLNISDSWVEDLKPLSGLENLRVLNLDRTAVTDLSPIASLGKLEKLDLANIEGLSNASIVVLSELPLLRDLDLSLTKVSDLTPLAGLRELTKLKLSGTEVSDLSPLSSLHKLESLSLAPKVADLGPLAGLANLRVLDVWGSEVTDLAPLTGLKLVKLNLGSISPINIEVLGSLTELKELWYENSGTDLTPIGTLPKIETLTTQSTMGLAWIASTNFPSLKTISLSGVSTEPTDLSPLAKLPSLTHLSLSLLKIDDFSPLGEIGTLQELYLNWVDLSGLKEVTPLTRLSNLRRLGYRSRGRSMFTDEHIRDLRLALPELEVGYY